MTAYYNEIDPYAAQWLRNLIAAGHIAPGEVDERSIRDVAPEDVAEFHQAHFFAGIGVWSHALRLAGWPDDQPVWTGSCPCQPFSAAGKQLGIDDERHLWPEFQRLIRECRPSVVFGEQVASALGREWFGSVRDDLEALGYAVAAADLGAASVGAPHIRQRLWWVGKSTSGRCERRGYQPTHGVPVPGRKKAAGGLADNNEDGRGGQPAAWLHGRWPGARGDEPTARDTDRASGYDADRRGAAGGLADAQDGGRREQRNAVGPGQGRHADGGSDASGGLADAAIGRRASVLDAGSGVAEAGRRKGDGQPGGGDLRSNPLHGFWRDADWLLCRDGKWRPVEPGTFPLAHGAPARVGRLRAYGNAIVAPLAAEFIQAVMDCRP